ncbi:RNA polymerase II mediator complex subunit [Exophiala xenobiotica]|nr:RNA polymerase II mediator complex subunit [Exophiala xenobiotica]KAK5448617.1 RNA polymerase II mediator complex subunit [Exophiala xenobiotica]
MTTNPPADSRPPSLRHPPGLHRPSLDRATSDLFSTIGRRPPGLQRQYTEPGQDRPAKRRKVEGDVQANQAATFNNGSTATATINTTTPADTKGPQLRLVAPAALQLEFGTLEDKKTSEPLVDDEPPDFPGRPWIPSQQFKAADVSQPTHRSRVYVPVPTTPDSMDSPSSAPRFVPKRPAGFFPWTGKHPEDVLSDTNVKQGYFDKPPNPTEKELNTARVPLYNAFKHKSGVDSLSTLLSLVLDKKSQQSLINPHTTFKPPPRVTLTEAKRKSWIADLANADVPLRKLSRTIPQGIRGQLLLDQCLQNFVPMSRAIWFAKCVCANEIRTLKRKGTAPALAMGAEGKWLREWTINVEQFLEAHLAQIGSTDWRTNIQYAVRITTRLYMENLLDRDHCLDWTLRSLAASPLDQLPFWLMITHIFRQDMSYYRRRGRKLAETLIEKYELVRTTAGQAAAPLTQRLHHAIRGLLLTRPRNFLMPDKWPEIYPIIRTCLDEKVQQERQILEELHRINERAMGFNRRDFSAKRSPVQAIVDVLDSLQAPVDVAKLAETLTTVCPDVDVVIFSCLEWACTRFQSSDARIYLFARLVRRWQRAGHATDTVILNYLSAYREGKTMTDVLCLSHLIAQLSRSDSFPTAKYLQWLMVRGLPKKGTVRLDTTTIQGAGVSSPDSGHFLLDLSLQNAGEHVLNLRNSILERCGFDLSSERDLYHHCIQYIGQELSQLGPSSRSETSSIAEPAFATLPWSIKSRISLWLRSRVVQTAMHDGPGISSSLGILSAMRLNCEQFSFIRYVLECMNDQAVLADVIGILCSSQDDDLVASLVATIQYHAESFMAIGAFEVLHKRACQIYMTWRTTKPAMTLLTNALLELCTAFPVKTPTLKFLQQNFVRGDRGRAVAACSPYSDGIAESLQQAGATFVEDFEAILQSEPNMTEQTMNGLFSVLVDRIEKQQNFGDDSPTMFSFCLLLSRLRLCRKAQADQLIQQWLGKLAPFLDGDFGPLIFQNLIGAGCLNFVGFFESISLSKLGLSKLPSATALLRYVTAPDKELLGNTAFYHTRTQWSHYCHQEPRRVLEVLCQLGKESIENPSESRLLYLLTNDRTLTSSALTEPATKRLMQALDRLLSCERGGNIEMANLRPLLNSVNVFSHRYVQLRLWLTSHLQAEQTAPLDQGQVVEALTDALEQILHEVDGVRDDGSRIPQLLEAVGPEVANRLRHKVEHEFLEALPRFPPGKTTSPLSAIFPGDAHHLSSIVNRAFRVCTKNTNPMPGFAGQLIDRLSQFFKSQGNNVATPTSAAIPGLSGHSINASPAQMMSVTSSPHASSSESVGGANGWAILNCLDHMLQMVCLQRLAVISAGRSGANVKQGQTEQVQLLVRLGLIFTHPTIASASKHLSNKQEQEKVKNVHDFILDVLATIVDEVGDEVKMMCAKLLKDKLHDARLKYLFGSVNITGSLQAQDMGHGLQMFKEGKGVIGEWRPRVWEILDNGSGKENETSLGLGLFTARRGRATED